MGKSREILAAGAATAVLIAGCGEETGSDGSSLETPPAATQAPTRSSSEASNTPPVASSEALCLSTTSDTVPAPEPRLSPTGVSFIFDDLLVESGKGEITILTYRGPGTCPEDRTPYMVEGLYFEKGNQLPVECIVPNGREVRSHTKTNDGERAVEPSRTWYRVTAPNGMHPFVTEVYGDLSPVDAAARLPRCLGATGIMTPPVQPQAQ